MIYQLETHIAQQLKDFFDNFDFIDKVVIFGSRAKHTANPKSDIDLCIYSLEMSDEQFSKLRFELDELPILYKLDIVHFEKVNKELQDNVEKDGKVLFIKEVKLGDILDIQNGYAFNSKLFNDKKGKQLIRIRDLKNGKKTEIKYNGDFDEKFLVFRGDYLIGMDGDFICYEWKGEPSLLNQRVCRLINFEENIEPKYIFYGINKFLEKINDSTSFVTVKHISSKQIKDINFKLPTLTKQKKIAKVLDRANELITLRKESIEKLDKLSKSIFIDMFGDPISNPMNWEVKNLKKISTHILSGNTPKGGSQVYVKEGILFFRSQNVWKNKILLDDIAYIDNVTHSKMKKSSLKHKDILITKTGRVNTENSSLGRASIFLGEDDSANINGHVYLIRLKSSMIHKFVLYILTTDEYRDHIRNVCVGAIDKRQLNKVHLEEFPIIFPPIPLQNKFANIIEKIEEQKVLYEKELKLLEDNFNSLLQRSFS